MELEPFYTPPVYQATQSMAYEPVNEQDHSALLSIGNPRFRNAYQFLGADKGSPYAREIGDKRFASVHHITVRNAQIFCPAPYFIKRPKNTVAFLHVHNEIDSSEFSNIAVQAVFLNGKRLTKEEIEISVQGKVSPLFVE